MVDLPQDVDNLDFAALKTLVLKVLEENSELRRVVADQKVEIARLKGLKGPPDIKPSGMDKKAQARDKAKAGRQANKARRGTKRDRVTINEERVIKVDAPSGSRFKGYEDYLLQDVVCRAHTVLLRRERWQTPDGKTIVAPLPAGTRGHYGPELQRLILSLYHGAQTTVERLTALLCDMGVVISKRQVVRLLNARQEGFVAEQDAVLRAGLETATWVSVDDTGARHQSRNGFTTQIGNAVFTWFGTTFSKSRLNFLELLRVGDNDYVVNDQALSYMRDRGLSEAAMARLKDADADHFTDQAGWLAHLKSLRITATKAPLDPARIATEGALMGAIAEHALLDNTVILSDGAGQFKVGLHALCWIHTERLVHKLDAFVGWQRMIKEKIQAEIWSLYADLKDYRDNPNPIQSQELIRRFDVLFISNTGFEALDRLLARIHKRKTELLLVLERPELPLHTNGSENDIRAHVTRRKLSGGTKSDDGKHCRDSFLGLKKTCQKLDISFWQYLGDRLKIPQTNPIPYLPDTVAAQSRSPV